jgi:tripartite-type tricarboxylate transporter receptor subunit TctC
VSMVVAAAAGGPIDVFGRVMAGRMGHILGQSVVVENVPGAGGMVGGQRVAKAEPDGYTAILGTIATHTFSQLLYKKPLYDAVTDFTPVTLVAEIPLVLIVRKDLPVNTLAEFVAYAKAHQSKMNYGSAGAGSATHLGCALLNGAIGTNIQHVPYKGTGPAMQDLTAGRLDFLCEIVVTAVPQIEAGNVKAVATLSRDRSPVLANLPTAYEAGFKDIQAYTWTALFLPKGTPAPVVARLRDAALQTMDTQSVQEQLRKLGATIVPAERRTPEYLEQFVKDELRKWSAPIAASGAVIE